MLPNFPEFCERLIREEGLPPSVALNAAFVLMQSGRLTKDQARHVFDIQDLKSCVNFIPFLYFKEMLSSRQKSTFDDFFSNLLQRRRGFSDYYDMCTKIKKIV
jgi:hypothetical protein